MSRAAAKRRDEMALLVTGRGGEALRRGDGKHRPESGYRIITGDGITFVFGGAFGVDRREIANTYRLDRSRR